MTSRRATHRSLVAATLTVVAGSGVAAAAPQPSTLGTVDVGRYPDARCNNGEAATFNYILSTDTGPADQIDYRKKWLVVLSGGGGCGDYASCAARWNESPQGPNLDGGPGDHGNMVPDLVTRAFEDHGLLDFDGNPAQLGGGVVGRHANPFAGPGAGGADGFNRVWINYCSSDSWEGLGTTVAVNAVDFPSVAFDPTNPALTSLHFGGARIVDAVIATIMRGEIDGTARPELVPDDVDGEIVLAGSSAGGGGTIRNLDTVAHDIATGVVGEFDPAPGVLVYGIVDAATAVGPLATPAGDDGYAKASFYTNGQPDQVRTDDDCDPAGTNRCYAVGDHVVQNEIATPYFVVQQAFDMNIHEDLKAGIAAAIRANAAAAQAQYPGLFAFAVATFGTPEAAAEAYIRYKITSQATTIGAARNNPAGLFIPNYATGWHQLMADSERFYTSQANQWVGGDHPGSPRLGALYAGTAVSIPVALAAFRQCVLGNYGAAVDYAGCVTTIYSPAVDQNARVINSTATP